MANKTAIQWTDATWNPIAGCSKVSDGCKNCYAEKQAASGRLQQFPKYQGTVNEQGLWTGKINLDEKALLAPLNRKRPTKYFVNSMSDLFHENVPDEWIDKIFAVMALCSQHTFQVLTKRPDRMQEYVASRLYAPFYINRALYAILNLPIGHQWNPPEWLSNSLQSSTPKPLSPIPNVWLGVSVENQQAADERIPLLLQTPAAVRFLSCEPLLGAVDLSKYIQESQPTGAIHLVIAGGESGPGARPMHPDWARSLRDQCQSAGVPFFFKQLSQANTKDFKKFHLFPEDLQIREFPNAL